MTPVYNVTDIYQAKSQINSYPLSYLEIFLGLAQRPDKLKASRKSISCGYSEKTVTRATNSWHEIKVLEKVRNEINDYDYCSYTMTDLGRQLRPFIVSIYNTMKWGVIAVSLASFSQSPVTEPGVPPIKFKGEETRDCYLSSPVISKNPSPSFCPSPSSCHPVIESYKHAQARARRSTVTDITTRQAINEVKSLKLTKWGVIRLHAFSDKVIRYAESNLRTANVAKLRDPWGFLMSLCFKESKRLGERPNDDLVQALFQEYDAPFDRQYFEKPTTTTTIEITPIDLVSRQQDLAKKRADVMTTERQKARERQLAWENSQSPERLQDLVNQVVSVENMTAQDRINEVFAILDGKENLTPIEKILHVMMKPRAQPLPVPIWSLEDSVLIEWAKNYIETIPDKAPYQYILDMITEGPLGPKAQNRELQNSLQLMKDLVEGKLKPAVQEAVPLELSGDFQEVTGVL